ncbi:MAG: hypothetical protein CL866_03655 [Cycloclasticus sp.]|nr:hypothetical protein [Cycloclasticus sp.]MBG95950.1 hypothetical protein [Cycloclasticus sp.]HAI97693.1 hypothetical protein [Methylococcaceae bacterium]|tara:strand:- start:2612 stop:2962 length:351 start_codon:yes stop_codon:yes gene_type:complete
MSQAIARPDISDIEVEINLWALPTTEERLVKRMNSTMEEINAFHYAMLPKLPAIIDYLNQFQLADLVGDDLKLSRAALAMCEVDNAVYKWKAPVLGTGIDSLRMIKKSGFSDRVIL